MNQTLASHWTRIIPFCLKSLSEARFSDGAWERAFASDMFKTADISTDTKDHGSFVEVKEKKKKKKPDKKRPFVTRRRDPIYEEDQIGDFNCSILRRHRYDFDGVATHSGTHFGEDYQVLSQPAWTTGSLSQLIRLEADTASRWRRLWRRLWMPGSSFVPRTRQMQSNIKQ